QHNTTYIGQRYNQQPLNDTRSNTNFLNNQPQNTTRAQRQTESRSSWNFPTRPREYQQLHTPVNAHSQNDLTTPNRYGPLMDDNTGDRFSTVGKQKAKSPLDQDITLKKQRASGVENEGIEMDTYSIGVTDLVSDNVSVPGSVDNSEFTGL
ncbi:MAG: hypothetical protein AB2693_22660, partial [Candidatus Thiodiazotropha sp.]